MSKQLDGLDLVILCGGRGVRLRPETDQLPKALVPVDGRAIIDHVADFLAGQGIDNVHLCIGYLGEKIRDHFSGPRPFSVTFSDLGEKASMLQRLHGLIDQLPDRFLVAYCDTFIDLSIADLQSCHQDRAALVTIVTAPIRNPFGIVTMNGDGMVQGFEEKPVQHHFVGLSMMERAALEAIPQDLLQLADGDGLVQYFQLLINQNRLASYEHTGLNITFNTVSEKAQAEQAIKRYYTLFEGGQASDQPENTG